MKAIYAKTLPIIGAAIVAIVVAAFLVSGEANAASVTYNIAGSGKIVWENDRLQVVDHEGYIANYTFEKEYNDIALDDDDTYDVVFFTKDDDANRQVVLCHDKTSKNTTIMPVVDGQGLSQWVVDDSETVFKE